MPDYKRSFQKGGAWFFTVVTHNRQPLLTHERVRDALRSAALHVRTRFPFQVDAWVLLPDHMHCVWSLPESDAGYAYRWSMIKRLTSQRVEAGSPDSRSGLKRRERGLWQRRFWEHAIRDEWDYQHHLEYCYWNPVKHGLVSQVRDWPYSTFHRDVRAGLFSEGWGGEVEYADGVGKGEP